MESPDNYLEGSPMDRNVYLLFIVIGFAVLLRRGLNWGSIVASNRWLFVFFLYCGISIIWSDYPFVSFKRWTKDLGNVIMVLIILSEQDTADAIRAVFARFTYLVIPLSGLFIKYYSELGKYYTRSWETAYCGVATEKNALGCLAMISGLFLLWDFIERRNDMHGKQSRTDMLNRGILLLMVFWLLDKAQSSTSIVTLVLGSVIIIMMQFPSAKRQAKYLGTYSLLIGILILALYSSAGIRQTLVGAVDRDITLTGRTVLWTELLGEPINPFFGTGYQSFWLGLRAERYWHKWNFRPNQAHNGYLETYLNGGLVGVSLLFLMILSGARRLKKELLLGSSCGLLFFSFLFVVLIYNWTEAMFNKMTPVWFILLTACLMSYARSLKSVPRNVVESANGSDERNFLKQNIRLSI